MEDKAFRVISYDFNSRKFVPYDVVPYFVRTYREQKERDSKELPKTYIDFRKWVEKESLFEFWARCEHEVILVDWPCQSTYEKWDVHMQIMMNLDVVTGIVKEMCEKDEKNLVY